MNYSIYIENSNTEEVNGLKLLYNNFNIVNDVEMADIVYFTKLNENNSKTKLLHYIFNIKYKNKKFILGPYIEEIPNKLFNIIKNIHNNVFVNLTSIWNISLWNSLNYNKIPLINIPVPIDIDKYNINNNNKTSCFIYINNRSNNEYDNIVNLLNKTKYNVIIINDNITEDKYLEILNKSKFGIWIGNKEYQNIKILQAFSCNIPIIVFDIYKKDTLNYITSIPYWDNECGIIFYKEEEYENVIKIFMFNINNYNPRKYIINNFTADIIYNKYWKSLIN